ncbi:MAG: hypothetical protein IIY56_06230, partial [Erysipelotrichaceae bacterium]|nr:hypothetical protein [Erysipelotrichaceae bacterium]
MNDYKLSDKLKYWLDKQLSKGTASIIKLLSICVISIVIFVSVVIVLFKLRDGFLEAFWDSLATIVNAWMPSSEDGEAGYIVLNTITAIVGLFFTSILIGVISSGIEAKLDSIRNGNSIVIEKDHTVILGYTLGEHGLLNQLIIATGDKKRCIVIYTDIEKSEIEQDLHNNVDIPKNIEVICRHGDITNINDLRYCSIDKARVIIINALNDNIRIKALLAVSMLKKEYPECNANIIACVSDEQHLLPRNKTDNNNIIMLKTDDIMAKMIAHTATEPGLSVAFKELLNFEGNELYFEKDERFYGKSVFELAIYIDKATLMGVKHNDRIVLNPDRDMVVQEGDEVLLFEEDERTYEIRDIDLKNKVIHVRASVVLGDDAKPVKRHQNKTASSTRDVPIFLPRLLTALEAAQTDEGPVVAGNIGTLRKHITAACKAADLPDVGVHGLRHSFASLCYSLGVSELGAMQIG